MSHFSCAVITSDNGKGVEDLLAPYSEDIVVAPYIRTSKKELIKEYEKMMKEAKNKPESYASQMQKRDNILGMSQEKFSRHFHGSDAVFDINGNLITTYNPRTEWSWYVIGGRWKNLLPMKRSFGGGKVDMAHIAEVDWEALNRVTKKDEKWYRRFWEINVLGKEMTKAEVKSHEYFSMHNEKYYLEYYGNVEKYIKLGGTFTTYAVVTPDGMWYAEGKMGMWGFSSEKPEEAKEWREKWYDRFVKPFIQLKEDHFMTIVDCHQ